MSLIASTKGSSTFNILSFKRNPYLPYLILNGPKDEVDVKPLWQVVSE
jgi:hypothetical protein